MELRHHHACCTISMLGRLDRACSPSGSKTVAQQVTSAAGSCAQLALHRKFPDSTVQALLLTAVICLPCAMTDRLPSGHPLQPQHLPCPTNSSPPGHPANPMLCFLSPRPPSSIWAHPLINCSPNAVWLPQDSKWGFPFGMFFLLSPHPCICPKSF